MLSLLSNGKYHFMFSNWWVRELPGHNHCHCRLAPGRPGHGPTHQSKLRDIVNICLHVRPDSDLFDSFHIKHNQKDFSKWWYIHQGPLEKQAQGFKGLNKGYQNVFSNLSYMLHRKKIRYTFLWVKFIHLIFGGAIQELVVPSWQSSFSRTRTLDRRLDVIDSSVCAMIISSSVNCVACVACAY